MERNLLVIDIGNTNVVCGIYTDSIDEHKSTPTLVNTWRMASLKIRTSDEYYVLIKNLTADLKIDYICVSSVVPSIGKTIEHMIQKYFEAPYLFVDGNTDLDIKYLVPNPIFIGSDLIVNAYSAWKKYQRNCIICDFGTATTVQLVGDDGCFYGTIIMPGMITGANGLFKNAALLSNIQIESPTVLLGTNTRDSLLSGLIKGHAYAVDGFIENLINEFNHIENIQIIATGGISNLIAEHSKYLDHIDKTLTLDGLSLIINKLLVTKSD